ncbi:hypothetical protein CVT26_008723 [Gymnopilus dilepis]|uniref:Uncharacterized protein n=1 Tax=Gymnopilus dilepis TaxID=231916 RepID=A0A409YGB1_9AGAR|nr:hypothetical protein CVT26_008723 [Gymnopilus dilepis]
MPPSLSDNVCEDLKIVDVSRPPPGITLVSLHQPTLRLHGIKTSSLGTRLSASGTQLHAFRLSSACSEPTMPPLKHSGPASGATAACGGRWERHVMH